ncbi:MAG: hypothetical protein PF503_07375 [Desulfobacula sp.]|jgi:hypothetical protein|nr:hypothetical protein [Desulfobacula sp.]
MDKILEKFIQYMPKGDDLTLVLKGHLLLEEKLELIISSFFPNAKVIHRARFSFHNKTVLSQAICWRQPDDEMWSLITLINSLCNDLAHNLESNKRESRCDAVIQKHLEISANDSDYNDLKQCPKSDQLKLAFIHALGFLENFRLDVESNSSFIHKMLNRQETLAQEIASQHKENKPANLKRGAKGHS